jgi:putative membrane protein
MLFLALKYFYRGLRQAWPLLLIAFVGRGGGGSRWVNFLYIALAITGLQMGSSIFAWFRYFFFVENEDLVVDQGLFSRKRTSIPLERIQSLQFEQTFLHRWLGVVKVRIETAGGSGTEMSLDALEQKRAEALRRFILARKADLGETPVAQEASTESGQKPQTTLLRLSPKELLRVGITQNHLRTAGLIIGGLFGLYQVVDDLFLQQDFETLIRQLMGIELQTWEQQIWMGAALLALAAVLGTLLLTVLRFYDLHLRQDTDGFYLTAGLLNRKEEVMRLEKLQYVRSSANPLQAALGLQTLRLFQAGSGAQQQTQAMTVPGCRPDVAARVHAAIFASEDQPEPVWMGISPLVIRRRWVFTGLLPALLGALVLGTNAGAWGALPLLWLGPAYWLARRYHQNFGYALDGEQLQVRAQLLVQRHTQLWLYKVQAVHLSQSLYQGRKDLADLTLSMAAGEVELPYLPLEVAEQLRDFVLHRIEVGKETWM